MLFYACKHINVINENTARNTVSSIPFTGSVTTSHTMSQLFWNIGPLACIQWSLICFLPNIVSLWNRILVWMMTIEDWKVYLNIFLQTTWTYVLPWDDHHWLLTSYFLYLCKLLFLQPFLYLFPQILTLRVSMVFLRHLHVKGMNISC